MRPLRPTPKPAESDASLFVAAATAGWAVAFVVSVVLRERLRDDGHLWWIGCAAAGFVLGLFGLWSMRRRDAAIARAQSSETAGSTSGGASAAGSSTTS